ncbi:MAG TPA: hypothetical protein VFP68_22645 [Burkholderiaceae bacterium]|nr:hypothetical protein [Burkholderiaceae bacterium]
MTNLTDEIIESYSAQVVRHSPGIPLFQSLREFVQELHAWIEGLGKIHPNLQTWLINALVHQGKYIPLDKDFGNLLELVAVATFDPKQTFNYQNLSPDGHFLPESLSRYGFRVSLHNEWPKTGLGITARSEVRIDASAGSATFYLPNTHYVDLHASSVMRSVFETTINCWQARRGVVGSVQFRQAAFEDPNHRNPWPEKASRSIWAGWMTYVRLANLASYIPEDIDFEHLPNNGVLMFASRERPSSEDKPAIDRARRIQNVLDGLCITQHDYLLDGWPAIRSEDEVRYAHQITGAPPDVAYRVALADFSGWDSERKVLLYARLFLDQEVFQLNYKPTHAVPLENKATVAEARRQLRSLELVNAADTPIEWHIGREELVEPMRTLLHTHAAIPEERLRVVYTPYAP